MELKNKNFIYIVIVLFLVPSFGYMVSRSFFIDNARNAAGYTFEEGYHLLVLNERKESSLEIYIMDSSMNKGTGIDKTFKVTYSQFMNHLPAKETLKYRPGRIRMSFSGTVRFPGDKKFLLSWHYDPETQVLLVGGERRSKDATKNREFMKFVFKEGGLPLQHL